jgi:hypothetical protein
VSDETLLATLVKFSSDRDVAVNHLRSAAPAPQPAPAERVTVASRPANTTTAAFRGRRR